MGKSATRTVGGAHCVHSSHCVQWPCPMNVQWAPIDPSIGHVPKCWKCPLVTNGHNRHSVFIIGDQWTCPMDKIDVHCVHFIVHNRHTRFTSICWRLRFGWWRPMSIISVMKTMDTMDTSHTMYVHWAFIVHHGHIDHNRHSIRPLCSIFLMDTMYTIYVHCVQ